MVNIGRVNLLTNICLSFAHVGKPSVCENVFLSPDQDGLLSPRDKDNEFDYV